MEHLWLLAAAICLLFMLRDLTALEDNKPNNRKK